ncbi:MAG: hypothetical protein HW400_371 [Candidatus Levybacteria bacterium]|nr:hypothetical protein [Candidatus Levybacteria bacterium]
MAYGLSRGIYLVLEYLCGRKILLVGVFGVAGDGAGEI